MNKLALLVPLALGALAVLPATGCSSNKNHDERASAPEAQGRPDYGNMSIPDLKLACIGTEEGKPWINGMPPECTPDPGSRKVNQAKLQTGYTFAWGWNLAGDTLARATYTYDDNTALFVVPERDSSMTGPRPMQMVTEAGWQPLADPIPPVEGITLTHAVRFRGGPFREYGGGFGQSFRTTTNPDGGAFRDENGNIVLLPPSPEFPSPSNGAYDLRQYEGIAIWVRRGPQGMSTMRVGITEKNSAEDLNSGAIAAFFPDDHPGIEENKHCRRWRLCGCAAGTPCTLNPATNNYHCYDPAVELDPSPNLPLCGTSRCSAFNTSTAQADPLYASLNPDGSPSAACTMYQTSDGRSDMFCYDPARGDPPPPAKRERCNNPFSRPITVTTDWQLIKVPFTELLQADEGNVADEFDLSAVKQIVVTHGGGWTDFWIANLGFYKKVP